MATEEIIRLIFSFVGGGLVAVLLDWLRNYFSEKKAQKNPIFKRRFKIYMAHSNFLLLKTRATLNLIKSFMMHTKPNILKKIGVKMR